MADYNPILDAEIAPDSPAPSILFHRLRDNPLAIAEGAEGAPGIGVKSICRSKVGDVPFLYTNPPGFEVGVPSQTQYYLFRYILLGTGSFRVKMDVIREVANSTLVIQRKRSRVSESWLTIYSYPQSPSFQSFVIDINYDHDDEFQIVATAGIAGGTPIRYRNVSICTAGSGLFPVSMLPLSPTAYANAVVFDMFPVAE